MTKEEVLEIQTEATSFYTTFYNLNWGDNGRIPVEEVANRVNSILEKFGGNSKSSEIMQKSSEKKFGDSKNKSKGIGKTAQKIIAVLIIAFLFTSLPQVNHSRHRNMNSFLLHEIDQEGIYVF